MSQLLETIYESLRELVASSIIILPAIITALIIIMLTRFF
ncbi:MAG: mechanosensitive ion channel family protein, partial [Symploca sp. SIO2D2]|nr:mechanosensitive ion channel family protein [Symploca sp. SIO2D2]